jgi:AP-1 complex subunit gamma-1
LHTYSAQKLYAGLKSDITQEGLTLAAAWVIGEYGDALLRGGQYEEEELVQEVKESDIVDLFSTILSSSYATQTVTEYIVTALVKLTTRLSDAAQIDRIRRLLQQHATSLDVEIQQRAVEYSNLFGYDHIRRGVLEKMPAPEIGDEQRVLGEKSGAASAASKKGAAGAAGDRRKKAGAAKKPGQPASQQPKPGGIKAVSDQDILLDLMGDGDPAPMPVAGQAHGAVNGAQSGADLLADILGGSDLLSSAPPPNAAVPGAAPPALQQPHPTSATTNARSAILDLFDAGGGVGGAGAAATPPMTAAAAGRPPAPPQYQAYNKGNLFISLQVQRSTAEAEMAQVTARLRNNGTANISQLALLAAVPKSQRLQLSALSSTTLAPSQEATQTMKITGVKTVSTDSYSFFFHLSFLPFSSFLPI